MKLNYYPTKTSAMMLNFPSSSILHVFFRNQPTPPRFHTYNIYRFMPFYACSDSKPLPLPPPWRATDSRSHISLQYRFLSSLQTFCRPHVSSIQTLMSLHHYSAIWLLPTVHHWWLRLASGYNCCSFSICLLLPAFSRYHHVYYPTKPVLFNINSYNSTITLFDSTICRQ